MRQHSPHHNPTAPLPRTLLDPFCFCSPPLKTKLNVADSTQSSLSVSADLEANVAPGTYHLLHCDNANYFAHKSVPSHLASTSDDLCQKKCVETGCSAANCGCDAFDAYKASGAEGVDQSCWI